MDEDSVRGRGETERDDEEDIAMTSLALASIVIDLAAPSLDVDEGTSLIASQAFDIMTGKKGLQYPLASIAVFVGVLDDGISLFSTQALETTTA